MSHTNKKKPIAVKSFSKTYLKNSSRFNQLMLIVFVFMFGFIGYYLLFSSRAAEPPPPSSSPTTPANLNYSGVSIRLNGSNTDTANAWETNKELKLISAMVHWKTLESTPGNFNFTQMDNNIKHAREHGYKIIFRVMAGANAPSWLYNNGVQKAPVFGTDQNGNQTCQLIDIPVYWDAKLEERYRLLMKKIGQWLNESDGASGHKYDHIFLVPVSMPTSEGSEMSLGYGQGECDDDESLRAKNVEVWNKIEPNEATRRSKTEQAWKNAIDIHMQELPVQTMSVVAYGNIFGDSQAAAKRIVEQKVSQYKERLWTMYTNLRPNLDKDNNLVTSAPHYKSWCPACDEVFNKAKAAGGRVGFQTAATRIIDTPAKVEAAAEDGLSYGMQFFEASPTTINANKAFLLTQPNNLQTRMAPKVTDTTSPTATLTSPSSGTSVSGPLTVNATATDDVGVTKVELLVDGQVTGTANSSPYSFELDTNKLSDGDHNLTVKAYDQAGNHNTSAAVTIIISNRAFLKVFTAANEDFNPTTTITKEFAVAQARQFDLIIVNSGSGTANSYKTYLADMKQANPSLKIVVYLNASYAQQSEGPASGQHAATEYAKQGNGHYLRSANFNNWLMDTGNSGWITNRVNAAKATVASTGFDGVWWDLLGPAPFFNGYNYAADNAGNKIGNNPATIPFNGGTNTAYSRAGWLAATSNIVKQSQLAMPDKWVGGNALNNGVQYTAGSNPTSAYFDQGINNLMAETALRDPGEAANPNPLNNYRPETDWKKDIDMLVDIGNKAKSSQFYVKAWGSAPQTEKDAWFRFGLSSFLLGTNGKSYFNFRYDTDRVKASAYIDTARQLGNATNTYGKVAGVYQRTFQKGRVVVNPTDTAINLPLGRAYKTLDGSIVKSLTLPAHGGEVLLETTEIPPPKRGDFNRDDKIDNQDLDFIFRKWRRAATSDEGDLSGDGNITLIDLSILLKVWGN